MYSGSRTLQSASQTSLRMQIRTLEESGLSATDILETLKRYDDAKSINSSPWGSSLWFYGAVFGVGCATYILSRILVPEDESLSNEANEEEWVEPDSSSETDPSSKRKSLDDLYSAIEAQSRRLEEAIALFTASHTRSSTVNGTANASHDEVSPPPVPPAEITIDKLLSALQDALSSFHDKHCGSTTTLCATYNTLLMYVNKIREFPTTQRYQRVSPSSSSFKQLALLDGYEAVMTALGFRLVDTALNRHSLPTGANRVYEWQWGSVLQKSDVPIVLEQAAVLIQSMRSKIADDASLVTGQAAAEAKPAGEFSEPPQAFKFDEIRRVASGNKIAT